MNELNSGCEFEGEEITIETNKPIYKVRVQKESMHGYERSGFFYLIFLSKLLLATIVISILFFLWRKYCIEIVIVIVQFFRLRF